MTGISALVMTLNEQQDLPACLESLCWCDDVHIFDSLSTDATLSIAQKFGAHVTQRCFDDESTHKNWGLEHIPFRHPWVFCIDADERVTPALAEAMRTAIACDAQRPNAFVAYRIPRRDHLMGRWLRHVVPSTHYIRLYRPAHVRYVRLINPVVIVNGPVGELAPHFDHFPFSKGISHWLAKHNRYSTLEAQQILHNRQWNTGFSIWKAFTEPDLIQRRFHQKECFYRLPMRPLIMFLSLYLLKRGFLDGRAGLTFALLRAFYEYMIVLKVREQEKILHSEKAVMPATKKI